MTDITERREAEVERSELQAQLARAQRMESLGSLAGGIAHDINNVLGAILGVASTSVRSQEDGSVTQRDLEIIVRACERGGRLLKGLLGFARQTPVDEREMDLNEILREEHRLLERTTLARVRLNMELEPGLHPVQGDASALSHAVMNLCVNAVDAMPNGGSLTLRTRNVDERWVEVAVGDTGHGMPKDVLAKALDPFFTTKPAGKGTGLGLSMVYGTVKAHRGTMEIESAPDQGTLVRLRFPVVDHSPVLEAPAAVPLRGPVRVGLHVLLVDDDELLQSATRRMTSSLGHCVTVAGTGEEALAAVESGLRPDLVVLDMNMPGLGGTGTMPLLRSLLPLVPVLLATGRPDQAALDLVAAHPGVRLLPKPYGFEEFRQVLDDLWEPAARGAPLAPC